MCVKYSKKRETVPDLPLWLWYSFGSMASLLQEVISIYPAIMPPTLTAGQSNRVCNALALMQCVASHKETRSPFLQGIFKFLGEISDNSQSLTLIFIFYWSSVLFF